MQTQWERARASLRKKISEEIYVQFFEKASIISFVNNHAIIVLNDNVQVQDVTPYKSILEACWLEANGTSKRIDFEFRTADEAESLMNQAESFKKSYETGALSTDYTFEKFVPGDKANLAYSAAFAVAENPDNNSYNPLFIYGAPGLGKTHLLQAIGNYIHDNNPEKRIVYITAHAFHEQYIKSLRNKTISDFSSFYSTQVDVLLIDDIQHWTNNTETQNEFFHIFNTLHNAKKRIVLTSDVPANDIKGLADRLISRFVWGLTVDIQPPDFDTRIAILRQKANNQHLEIAEDVITFLAEHITGNVRLLESAIISLTVQSGLLRQDIDLNIARKVVTSMIPNMHRRVNVSTILQAVSKHYEVPVEKLTEQGRGTQEVSRIRQIAMFLTKELSVLSLQGIGQHFGNRNHATVIHAIKLIKSEMEKDPNLEHEIEKLKQSIRD